MNTDFFANIRKRRAPVDLFYRKWERKNGAITHSDVEREELSQYVAALFSGHVDTDRIRIW